jgi:hypothetical protein
VVEKAFIDPDTRPAPDAVAAVTAGTAAAYRDLVDRTAGFVHDWSFTGRPGRGGGWLLKVHHGRKALCYVLPGHGCFVVRLTLREAERAALVEDDALLGIRPMLQASRKYPEGYLLEFDVTDAAAWQTCASVLDRLIPLRRT